MASFLAKQILSNQLAPVKELADNVKPHQAEKKEENVPEIDPELEEERREEFQKRRDMYLKMENVREKMRQVYRDKYNLKKRDEAIAMQLRNLDGTLNAQKKDSSMLEIKVDEEDEFNPFKKLSDLFINIKTFVSNIKFPWSD